MTKLFTTTLYLCILFFGSAPAFAGIEPGHENIHLNNVDVCEAPPPDSFRITKIGVDFISLDWKPAWPGADQQIDVFIENNNGGWTFLYSISSVWAASKTVDNLESGKKYGFKIATKCSNGDPSVLTAFVDGITVIIELTLNGRMPVNPTQVNCQGINLLDPENEWVGYRISWVKQGKFFSSLFEFEADQESVAANNSNKKYRIKRVEIENPVVAANDEYIWPKPSNSIVDVHKKIFMLEMLQNGIDYHTIGNILLKYDPINNIVDICDDKNQYWDNYYKFEALVAQKVKEQLIQSNDFALNKSVNVEGLKAENPFKETLTLFIPNHLKTNTSSLVQLISLGGQVVFEYNFEPQSDKVLVPIASIKSGFYIIRIELGGEVYNLKAVKLE